jgi:hypothetical protein
VAHALSPRLLPATRAPSESRLRPQFRSGHSFGVSRVSSQLPSAATRCARNAITPSPMSQFGPGRPSKSPGGPGRRPTRVCLGPTMCAPSTWSVVRIRTALVFRPRAAHQIGRRLSVSRISSQPSSTAPGASGAVRQARGRNSDSRPNDPPQDPGGVPLESASSRESAVEPASGGQYEQGRPSSLPLGWKIRAPSTWIVVRLRTPRNSGRRFGARCSQPPDEFHPPAAHPPDSSVVSSDT